MKIKDIISENAVGKISKRYHQATVGLNKFKDPSGADRVYELNRVMMAAASSDGVNPLSPEIDSESWAGRHNIAVPYTEIEQKMLKQAFSAIGSAYTDMNHGDMKSKELAQVNKTSPTAKPKRNKYGV